MDTSQLLYQQGLAFHRQGLLQEAQKAYRETVRYNPRHAPAWHALGIMAAHADDPTTGLQLFAKALSFEPSNPVFLTNASNALISLSRFDEALALCQQALEIKPEHVPALRNQGVALTRLFRYTEAIQSFDQALHLSPEQTELYILCASALCELKAYPEAIAMADRLLDSHPGHAMAWFSRGSSLTRAKRYSEAVQSYAQAMSLDPRLPYLSGSLLYAKMHCCDWADLQVLYQQVKILVSQNTLAIKPFAYTAICDDESSLRLCSQQVSQNDYPSKASAFVHPAWPPHAKIRLGYLCGEFREHATSVLMAEVWECHDKSKFEIFAFDNGLDKVSARADRINQAFDHVIDIHHMEDLQVANLIYAHQIDILVNVNGFTGRERNNVFAMRPSPVQVNYLGFPGTMGAPYMDYLIADKTVIPPESQRHYTEKVVYLPGCYQPNDTHRVISKRIFTREELGLPPDGFVFCCFNNNYKITPTTFDVWMRILQQVPGSVLWLLEDTHDAAQNLQSEAVKRGVDADRLVYAKRAPNDDHLARHAMADLFLDTWPYNAHTTASDALWAGLPLLTLRGTTFPGRVASSLLNNLQLSELVTHSEQAYEAMALRLASDKCLLASLKSRLLKNRYTNTPFKPIQHTLEMEALFQNMAHPHSV